MDILKKFASVLRSIFGSFTYHPPKFIIIIWQWIKKIFHLAVKKFNKFSAEKPKATKGILIATIILLVIFFSYKIWQSYQPEPKKLAVTFEAPGLTLLEKNAIPDPINVRFNGSAARLEDVQKEISTGIEINPHMPGEWKWIKDDHLQFTPASDWPAGTEYTIKMNENLFPPHILLKEYEGTIKTPSFNLTIISNEFYIDPVNEDLKQIAATVKFSHPVKPESFINKITLRPYKIDEDIENFKDRNYTVKVTYDDFFGEAYILSEGLPMPDDDVTMQLTIKERVETSLNGNKSFVEISSKVTVPGITNFIKIGSVSQTLVRNDDYKLEQILVINSKGKARSEDLKKNMEVWILPKDKPKTFGSSRIEDYRWSDPAMVGPEVIKHSTKAALTPVETELEYESMNSFKINVEPGKYIYVKLKKGTPFYGKYNLSLDYDRIIRIANYPKQLEIMHDGIILSSTGEKKVSLVSQGVEDIQFRIGRVQPDQLNHLITQSYGDLKNIEFRNYYFDEDNFVENYYEERSLHVGEPGEANYFSFNFSKYLKPDAGGRVKNGVFFFEIREYDRKHKRVKSLGDKRLIMISDLGVLVKDGSDDTHDLFVQSTSTGLPVGNAKVQVLGKNGIPILSSYTDINGRVSLPSLRSFKREKTATVYIISKGNDLSFLPVEAPGRWLNYSRFDVGGVYGATHPSKINSYLFSERGIYRPGDEFNIGMIVKRGDWSKTLAGTPLEAAIIDSRGVEIYKKKYKLSPSGFDELNYRTESSSPTGTYQINLYTIRKNRRYKNIGSTTIKVEEFLPDRLAIASNFPGVSDLAWVSPDNLTGQVTLNNLFGSPARGNRIVAKMSLSPGRMWFKQYKDFMFNDPLTTGKSFTETLPEKTTDKEGKAFFDFNLTRFEDATYTLSFWADGFEKEGGRNVSTESRILVSPLSYLLGTKANGDLNYIYKNSERKLKVIAINPELKKIAVSKVEFILNQIQHVSVLTKLPNETFAYKSAPKKVFVSKTEKSISANGLDYTLPTNEPGEYELLIQNSEGIQFSRILFSVVGKGNITRSLDKTAELEIKLNKKDYKPGEEIEIYVKAPYKGAGLITIERDKIYASQWFKSQSNSFIKKIRLPRELEGNGYINVSFVRATDSKEIYMSPLSYGIAPFSVSKKNRMNSISIDIPDKARSGKVFPIKYKTSQPGRIAIFAVDEGILQVAGYNTPDPLEHFFKKRALEVKTSQLLDLILPEFKLFQLNSATGGGTGFDDISKNLNPFKRKQHKPVVYWSGLLNSDGKERTLNYTVPDYFNGTLRVMAVVVSQDAIGTYEEKAIVKNPYIISPNVPMFAAPQDSFLVTVTVTNSVAGSGKKSQVNLSVTSTPHLKVYNKNRKLFIDEDGDTTLTFSVKANNLPGSAELTFSATGKKETAKLKSYLSVRPAVPYQTRITTGVLQNDDIEVETPRQLYKDYRVLNTSVSFLPLGLSKGLVTYLDRFPYGCSEQVVSQAFPYLYLNEVTGFGIKPNKASEKVKYALKVLQARQNTDGKFGIWAANSHTSDFITVYGMQFITECKKAGYYVSENLYNNAISALKSIAGEKRKKLKDLRIQAYAIYILTQNEIITTNYIATLRKSLEKIKYNWEEELTGAYLAGSYKIMKQNGEANSIFDQVIEKPMKTHSSWHFYNDFIQNAQLLYLLSEHSPEMLEDVSAGIISELASFLKNRYYNTITSSYTIMALTAYSKAAGEPKAGEVLVKQILHDKSEEMLLLPSGQFLTVDFSEHSEKLEITNKEDFHLYYQVVQGGFDTSLPEKRVANGIEIFREFTDEDGNVVNKVSLGDEVEVHLKFRSLNDKNLYNIAIVDLLPAGLEAVPTSVRKNLSGTWNPDHTDIREDRLVVYGTVRPSVSEFIYKVRAINKGSFTVPPIYAESMYDKTIYGFSPQEPIVVE
ncbi:MAG: MG2 domain-containing protein [Bacteroidota bacterium]